MTNLFVYGTLMKQSFISMMLGRDVVLEEPTMCGVRREGVKGAHFPGVVFDTTSEVDGAIALNLTDEDMAKLDRYEGVPHLYERHVMKHAGLDTAIYILVDESALTGEEWEYVA